MRGSPPIPCLSPSFQGFDWQLLRTIDLNATRPLLLRWENMHLSSADAKAARQHCMAAGYRTADDGFDTFAWLSVPYA